MEQMNKELINVEQMNKELMNDEMNTVQSNERRDMLLACPDSEES